MRSGKISTQIDFIERSPSLSGHVPGTFEILIRASMVDFTRSLAGSISRDNLPWSM